MKLPPPKRLYPLVHLVHKLPKKVQSANRWTQKWGAGARYIYRDYHHSWFKVLALVFPPRPRLQAPKRRGKILIRATNLRLFDPDNFIFGNKPILDYFVQARYFFDDSEEWLERELIQEKGKQVITAIEIWYPPDEVKLTNEKEESKPNSR